MIGSIAMCMKLTSFCSYIYAYLQSCGLFYTCEVTGKGYLLNIAPVWPHIVILPVTVLTWKVTRRLAFETINLFWGYQGLLSPMNKGPVQWVGWIGHQPVDRYILEIKIIHTWAEVEMSQSDLLSQRGVERTETYWALPQYPWTWWAMVYCWSGDCRL